MICILYLHCGKLLLLYSIKETISFSNPIWNLSLSPAYGAPSGLGWFLKQPMFQEYPCMRRFKENQVKNKYLHISVIQRFNKMLSCGKKLGRKRNCYSSYGLCSPFHSFVCFGCNFTLSSTMHVQNFINS